jgi:prephenate decarboxylase
MIINRVNTSLKELCKNYFEQLEQFLNYLNALEKIEVATLGPSGTSSEATGFYLLSLINRESAQCSLYPSYENAMESVISQKADLLLVANAYGKIDVVYMCPKLRLLTSFEYPTPCYGLAKKTGYQLPKERPLKIATHHAPLSLISQFMDNNAVSYEVTLVESTSRAAIATQEGNFDMCITNSNSVHAYDLEFISETRQIFMVWSVFGRSDIFSTHKNYPITESDF